MALSCSIIPTLINKEGKEVESRLFRDLLRYTKGNRELVKSIYGRVKNTDFIRDFYPHLELDNIGEPTLKSLYETAGLKKVLDNRTLMKAMNEALGAYGSDGKLRTYKDSDYRMLLERVREFNKMNPFRKDYVADVTRTTLPESSKTPLVIVVQPRNALNSLRAEKLEYNEALNDRLREILHSHGVTDGALLDLEERRGIAGVTDFDVARDAATGMIEMIRLAKGERGEAALPEEFAHFALAAMKDNPLVTRLINMVYNEGLAREVLGESYDLYNTAYKGDEGRLAKEAAGKLLAKYLLRNAPVEGEYKNFLQRVIQAVKDFFSKFTASQFREAMIEAEKASNELAKGILTGAMDREMSVENISESHQFLSVEEKVDGKVSVLQRIINQELKRLQVYKRRNPKDNITREQLLLIDKLERAMNNNEEIKGIFTFLSSALKDLRKCDRALTSLNSNDTMDSSEKASALRDLRNTFYSYADLVGLIQEEISEDEIENKGEYTDEIRETVDTVAGLTSKIMAKYKKVSLPMFVEFMRPVAGDRIKVPIGKFRNKEYTLEQLIKSADSDISLFDRWLDSMADSSDIILQGMDRIVKKNRDKARRRTIEIQKTLMKEGLLLEQSGTKGFDFMFRKDKDGKTTGEYVMEVDQDKYAEARKAMYERLKDKYKEERFGIRRAEYTREVEDWFSENTVEKDGVRVPKASIYGEPEYKAMNEAQRRFYDAFMEIKQELDTFLPEGSTTLRNAVQIRKDIVERVQGAAGIKGGVKEVVNSIKDQFLDRVDDTGYARSLKDAEGNEVQSLPIYFVRKLENPADISTDAVSTLSAYASMALDYHYMGEILDELELGRDVLQEREIIQRRGGQPVMEKIRVAGREVEDYLSKKGKGRTHFSQRLDDFFEMQVYGRYMQDEGSVLGVSLAKLANNLNRYTSVYNLGLNLLAGVSNVATGTVMMNIEAFTGEFFTAKDTLIADKNYGKLIGEHLANIGQRVKTDKLSLWDEYFDVMQDYEEEVSNTDFDKKTWFTRLLGSNAVFFLNSSGEHWMQNRTSMALANSIKLKDKNGKKISLFDAYETVVEKKNGKAVSARLKLKDGVTKEDGSAWTKDDEFNFKQKAAAINQGMHGIYNKADRSAIQKTAVGRLAMLYRKWIRPNYMKRFKSARYNMDLGQWTQGYYNTSAGFILTLLKDMRNMQFQWASRYNELTKEEKYNLKRAATEVGHFIALVTFLGLMEWDDDGDRPWALQMAEYQARRLYTELGAQVPGPQMLGEGLRILNQPAAGLNTIQRIIDTTKLVFPSSWTDEIESGRYEGYVPAQKYILELVPMRRTIYNALSPEESLAFFKTQW